MVDNSKDKSRRGLRLDRIYRVLMILERKLFDTKMKIESLERKIHSRNSITLESPFSELLLFEGIEQTHPEIYHFILMGSCEPYSRSKDFVLEFKQLKKLMDRENEKRGYIEKQHNSLLEKVNNHKFKTFKDKDKAVEFLSRYYNIETLKRRIKDLKILIPEPVVFQHQQNERNIQEELKLERKKQWVEKFEPQIKKLRKWCHEEFEELNMPDFNNRKSKKFKDKE